VKSTNSEAFYKMLYLLSPILFFILKSQDYTTMMKILNVS